MAKKHESNANSMLDENGNPMTARQLAENYGYAWSFLKQHSDVWKVFQQAVKSNYSPDRFKSAIRGTNWWKKTEANVRQYQLEIASDPAGVAAKIASASASLSYTADQMGATLSKATLKKMATSAYMHNWTPDQIRAQLGSYVKAVNGVYHGDAEDQYQNFKSIAYKNGIHLSSTAVNGWIQAIEKGKQTRSYYEQYIRDQAKALAPSFAHQLDSGVNLMDIASPYMEAKARLLQLDPANVDLFDNDVRQALSAKTPDGKPTSMSLWEFEQSMRHKPEYMKTDAARDSAYSIAHRVLSDFGFMGN